MNIIDKVRFALALRRAERELRKEWDVSKYDLLKTLGKGGVSFLKTSLALALTAVVPVLLGYWSDPAVLTNALTQAGLSPALVLGAVPVVTMILSMLQNWYKNRGKAV